jgi:MFS superfamily sulfate permease-like transporter
MNYTQRRYNTNSKTIAMKKMRTAFGIILAGLVFAGFGFNTEAQNKKKSHVKVKVISDDGKKVIEMDTTINHDVFVFDSDKECKFIELDSIMKEHEEEIEKHMKVFAIKMDSLKEFNFKMDGEMEEIHLELEKVLKEKGIHLEELEHLKEAHKNRIMIIKDGDGEVIEEFIDGDGDKVKIIKKEIKGDKDGKHEVKTIVIASDSHGQPYHWKGKHAHKATVKVESIPIEDIAVLKKFGVSAKKLLNEQIDIKGIKVKIEKILEEEKLQTLMQIECDLPEGDYHLEFFNEDGKLVKEEKNIKAGSMKQEFELKEEEAPYYLILSKNNQFFGRKVVL